MDLFPAIDLRGGRVVQLVQGDFDAETVYAGPCGQLRRGHHLSVESTEVFRDFE